MKVGHGTPVWGAGRSFETTQWSIVLAAGREASQEALAALCEVYWQPVFAFIRSKGVDPEQARDVTQGFFAGVLARKDLTQVTPERGRFRNWLRAGAKNHLQNVFDYEHAKKRYPGSLADLDAVGERALLAAAGPDQAEPERVFDRQWALTVAARARVRMREHYEAEGKGDLFAQLAQGLSGEEVDVSDEQLAAVRGKSVAALRTERSRLKKDMEERLVRFLRAEVGCTVSDPAAVDDELQVLLDALG